MLVNTSQDRQTFILSSQFLRALPSQMVPLINQQRFPLLNSQAGHCFFFSVGHFFILQQGLLPFGLLDIRETMKNNCLSTAGGMVRQPCS